MAPPKIPGTAYYLCADILYYTVFLVPLCSFNPVTNHVAKARATKRPARLPHQPTILDSIRMETPYRQHSQKSFNWLLINTYLT